LPQNYAFATASAVRITSHTPAAMTAELTRQVFQSAQLVYDVLAEGALAPGGRGVRAVLKVRLLHAAYRHLILRPPGWDRAGGVPLNQEDLAAALLAISHLSQGALPRLGVAVTPAEADAWQHTWAVIGHLFGVREELLPRTAAEAGALWEVVCRRGWA